MKVRSIVAAVALGALGALVVAGCGGGSSTSSGGDFASGAEAACAKANKQIVAMARALGLRVVAEGIETEEQRAAIVREGCEKWQGFLGGAPMTAAEFALIALR